jgi:hypothetical protein
MGLYQEALDWKPLKKNATGYGGAGNGQSEVALAVHTGTVTLRPRDLNSLSEGISRVLLKEDVAQGPVCANSKSPEEIAGSDVSSAAIKHDLNKAAPIPTATRRHHAVVDIIAPRIYYI